MQCGNFRCTRHTVAVLEPGAALLANRQRCAENAAVECMAGQPEPVLLSATRNLPIQHQSNEVPKVATMEDRQDCHHVDCAK